MEAKNLRTSRFAPRTPAEKIELSRAQRLKADKEKSSRLFERLRWKADSLVASYTRAMEVLHAEMHNGGQLDQQRFMFTNGTGSKQAEAMFKVDFFEFYALLERYLTLCLSILGVYVSSTAPRTNVNALRFITNPEYARSRAESSHRFHANLLDALDDEGSPFHPAFGDQETRVQLRIAKDYRNHWKDADEHANQQLASSDDKSATAVKLSDLELQKMLMTIMIGCERALQIVQNHTQASHEKAPVTSQDFEPRAYENMEMEDDEYPLEYMDDAMDLD